MKDLPGQRLFEFAEEGESKAFAAVAQAECVRKREAQVRKLLVNKVKAMTASSSAGEVGAAQENRDNLPQQKESK